MTCPHCGSTVTTERTVTYPMPLTLNICDKTGLSGLIQGGVMPQQAVTRGTEDTTSGAETGLSTDFVQPSGVSVGDHSRNSIFLI
jgi:hypothetical protein